MLEFGEGWTTVTLFAVNFTRSTQRMEDCPTTTVPITLITPDDPVVLEKRTVPAPLMATLLNV